ncbi:TonB-dependent receptor domain-containing protein [Sphingomonas sp.]|uniref:TonB-dependent receptor domain-containing protein n=1 Tax=Sphingomonas sp. TaxID=28214 RepID=UPI0028986428|nr:TonB-dependent receptor [Sphingomonas sp.]
MKKSAFLGACSLIAYFVTAGTAVAQQVPSPSPKPDQVDPLTGVVPVPQNSDAADEEQARKNVERSDAPAARAGNAEARADEAELRRYQTPVIAKTKGSDDILVTGSRLRDGDQTTRLTVIDAKEIRDRGVTTVEELIRTLSQNVATIGAITNSRGRGPLSTTAGPGGSSIISDVGGLGVSAANLGGVGAGNTLILVNGRRIAGAAGIEQGYANLNGIPLNAIERVEISNGGQAAIYGADAMGGVINFILKKNYVGTTISASRKETSSGARDTRISLYTGRAWGSGSASASLEFGAIEPIVNAKTGYVTNDYSSRYGGNSFYDRRNFATGTQPANAVQPAIYDPVTFDLIKPQTGLTVPKGFAGAPKRSDLIEVGLAGARDYVAEFAGPRTRSVSATVTFDQKITDRLRIFGTGLYSRSRNSQTNAVFGGIGIDLAPGQYYNPFPAFGLSQFSWASRVNYFPEAELADGSLVAGDVRNTSVNWNVNGGVGYDFGKAAKLQLIYTKSESTTEGRGQQLGLAGISFNRDTKSPTGYSCYNFQLANNRIPANRLEAYKAAVARQCLALSSSDPNIAFNPWKSTTNGGGSPISDFFYPYVVDDLGNKLDNVEARLNGELIALPGGSLTYAAGAEYSRNSIKNEAISNIAGPNPGSGRYAFFGEVNLPILGRGYDLPLAKRLLFNIALRRDVTSSTGAIGTVNNVPVDRGGEIIYGKNEFARTTPAWGVLWSPTNTIDIRAKFTRGFKAPPPTQLFALTGTQTFQTVIAGDPLYTCTTDCLRGRPGSYVVPLVQGANPDLRPETSRQQIFSATWQPTGFLSGLNLAVTYNRNRIRNQFATTRELGYYLPYLDILKLQQFYPRAANGKVTQFNNFRYNIIGSNYESMTYEASYLFSTDIGTFQPKIVYLDNMVAETMGLTDTQKLDQRGRILGVDKYKIVGSLQWNVGTVSTNVFVYHTPSYLNDYFSDFAAGVQLNPDLITRVAPLTTVDLSVSWVVSKNLNLQLAGRNILKAQAPFTVVDYLPYDTARYNIEGRSVVLTARMTF